MKKPTTPENLRSTASPRAVTAVALVDSVSADAPASHSGRRKSLRRQHDRTQRRFLACERRQLAQQIHDDLGGVLTALMGTIAVAIERDIVAKRAPNTLMLDARTLASAAFASVSKIGTNLRPTLLEEMGLLAGIEWQVRSLGLRRGMRTSFYFDARLELADLPDECERIVFRVVSEAINNTEKHAKASTLQYAFTDRSAARFVRRGRRHRAGIGPAATRRFAGPVGDEGTGCGHRRQSRTRDCGWRRPEDMLANPSGLLR